MTTRGFSPEGPVTYSVISHHEIFFHCYAPELKSEVKNWWEKICFQLRNHTLGNVSFTPAFCLNRRNLQATSEEWSKRIRFFNLTEQLSQCADGSFLVRFVEEESAFNRMKELMSESYWNLYSTDKLDQLSIFSIIERSEDISDREKLLAEFIASQAIVVVKKSNGSFVRAHVLSILYPVENILYCCVDLVDETIDAFIVEAEKIYFLEEAFSVLPAQVLKIYIHGLHRYRHIQGFKNAVYSNRDYITGPMRAVVVDEQLASVSILGERFHSVDYPLGLNGLFMERLIEFDKTVWKKSPFPIRNISVRSLGYTGNVVISRRSPFTAHLIELLTQAEEKIDEINASPYVEKGELFICKDSEGNLKRAVPVKPLPNNSIVMKFVDDGTVHNTERKNIYNINEFDPYLHFLPHQAKECILFNVQKIKEKSKKILEDFQNASMLIMEEGRIPVVQIFNELTSSVEGFTTRMNFRKKVSGSKICNFDPCNTLSSCLIYKGIAWRKNQFTREDTLDASLKLTTNFIDTLGFHFSGPSEPLRKNERHLMCQARATYFKSPVHQILVQPLKRLSQLRALELQMEEIYGNSFWQQMEFTSPVCIATDSYFAAFFEDKDIWARVMISESSKENINEVEMVEVYALDYGTYHTVDKFKIRALLDEFCEHPPFSAVVDVINFSDFASMFEEARECTESRENEKTVDMMFILHDIGIIKIYNHTFFKFNIHFVKKLTSDDIDNKR